MQAVCIAVALNEFVQLHREPGLKKKDLNDLPVRRRLSFLVLEGKRFKCVGSKTASPFDNF